MSLSLENGTDGQTLLKTLVKTPTHIAHTHMSVFGLVVNIFSEVGMGDYSSKRHGYLGIKKKSLVIKWDICRKTQDTCVAYPEYIM